MNQGKIIEYIDKGNIICAICLEDRSNRLHLLTTSNREVNISLKRAFLISERAINLELSKGEQLRLLKEIDEERDRLKKQVNVPELWELVKDEKETYDFKYLSQLCFGEDVTDNHVSALVRALFEDRTYFKLKDGSFIPNSEEKIEQIIRQREEEKKRNLILELGARWLMEVASGRPADIPPYKEEIIRMLINYVVFQNEAPDYKYTKELLKKAQIGGPQKIRDILIDLGIWDENENIELIRLDIRRTFKNELIEEAKRLSALTIERTGREDLTTENIFTIDGPLTRDFDDAISIKRQNGDYVLGIHISDVASVVPEESTLDREARLRGSSIYLPRQQIPMFPPELSQNSLSLLKDKQRRAISLISRIDKEGNIIDVDIFLSILRVNEHYVYDDVNAVIEEKEEFQLLNEVTFLLQKKRIEKGAMLISLPEISIEFSDEGKVSVRLVPQDTPSRRMIAEAMILYNWAFARFARENNIPMLYRTQDTPNERLNRDNMDYIYFVFKQRRRLNPLIIDIDPAPHSGLGLDIYTNATSPIRRYFDLVVQRQIRNFLLGEDIPYTREELDAIRMELTPAVRDIERIKQSRIRYWVIKYIKENRKDSYNAIVIDEFKNNYRVVLTDFLITADLIKSESPPLAEGDHIRVKIKDADPWEGRLTVIYKF